MPLLTRREKRLLESYNGLNTFLQESEVRIYFVGLIKDYRKNNEETPELLATELQINYLRGCIDVLSDDLFEILKAIIGDPLDEEARFADFYEMIAKYLIDVADEPNQ